jgi:hypothetical protein
MLVGILIHWRLGKTPSATGLGISPRTAHLAPCPIPYAGLQIVDGIMDVFISEQI